MASMLAAGVACCCCCGVAQYLRSQSQSEHSIQSYKAVATADVALTDDEEDDVDDLIGDDDEPNGLLSSSRNESVARPNPSKANAALSPSR